MKAIGRDRSETGTTISFKPDAEVFEEVEWDAECWPSDCARRRS